MVEVSPSLSSKIRNMSILSAFMVVMIHCRPNFQAGTIAWWVKQFTENGFTQVAVPFFFIVSGFFIAPKMLSNLSIIDGGGYKREVMKRIRSLVIPYVIWVSLFWFFLMGWHNISCICQGLPLSFFFPTLGQWGIWHANCPLLTPLWYVRGLFILVLGSPVLLLLLRRFGLWTLGVLFVAYGLACPYAPMPNWGRVQCITRCGILPVLGVFYFTLGMAVRLGIVRVWMSTRRAIGALAAACVLMGLRAVFNDCWYSPYFGMLSIPLALYGIWNFVPASSWPHWLVANSFAVFLIHKFVLCVTTRVVAPGSSLTSYFLVAAFAFLTSLIIANMMRAFMPRISAIMFGGR